MESPLAYPESPLDIDETPFPCKGCGEILEEGKAFELADNRWHIDCFRCNTCNTLLDSDANLLLLGDGSLICNNCTYSCSNCGNKIEDLAILTGDQAFCANCFKCRNCKKKIENLRYARTSQGIFCMDCHEALMAKRRKKTARNAAQRQKLTSNNNAQLDKSLPAIPPPEARKTLYSSTTDTRLPETSEPTVQMPSVTMSGHEDQRQQMIERRDPSPAAQNYARDGLTLPSTTFKNNRQSVLSQRSDISGASGDDFHIPIAFDPTPPIPQSPYFGNSSTPKALENSRPKDYFGAKQGSAAGQKEGNTSRSLKGSSPHIAYLEKGRQPSTDITDPLRRRRDGPGSVSSSVHASPLMTQEKPDTEASTPISQTAQDASSQSEPFRLQEAPKNKNSTTSHATAPRFDSANGSSRQPLNSVAQSMRELNSDADNENVTPRASYEYDSSQSQNGAADSSKPMQHPATGALASLPKRGDSLDSAKRSQTIPRKEVNPSANIPQALSDAANSAKINGGKTISKPVDSPQSKSIFDTPSAVQSQLDEASGDTPKESFIAPRAPPPLPAHGVSKSRNESTSTTQSEAARPAEAPESPALPRYSAGGDFSMDEDMARILGEDGPQDSFLKRVSNSVRHGRSFSDKGGRLSRENRWPRSPINAGAMPIHDLSSPSTGSPENRDDLAWFKNELRREKLRASEREKKIADLEAALESSATVRQVNSELREKRSTMVVLDTQKEIVVRELELLTEHIAAAKKSGEPLDLGKMNNTVLKEFAESLQKLKDSFAPQIEQSTQRRNDLVDEISKLTQAKEKSFQEFEQLSSKNAQLADLNNQLVHQIQGLYKTGAGQSNDQTKAPNGLGIYAHHKDKSQISIDSRTMTSEMSLPSSNTTLQADDGEPATATVIQGPHVVNIRKGQPKKFNWKGKSSNVAKGVTKGLKGAFSSTQQNYSREPQFADTAPYGSTPPGQEYSSLPRNNPEPIKQGFPFFGNQKPVTKPNGMTKTSGNDSTPSLLLDPATNLFGSDLEQRAEYEKTSIPGIISKCIEEVEQRGMDAVGIYRKSGGNSQVQNVKEGFERSVQDLDLSDPDLDINAVTSCLKQYFRRLPNPLITYEVYDQVLETTGIAEPSLRVEALARALSDLPKVHWDVLEHLMLHLSRVVARNEENLMTSSNIAVVFAPTIMRPESLSQEMTDTAKKNEVVQFLVENCRTVFKG